jgi:phosphatidylethanolamine-binding protein (PEBP) family uncharacterized protein
MEIKVKSTAFEKDGMIPKKYTCDGPNTSSPLSWTFVPEGTKSLALICDNSAITLMHLRVHLGTLDSLQFTGRHPGVI